MIFTFLINGFIIIINGIVNLIPRIEPHVIFTDNVFIDFADLIFDNLGLIDLIIPLNIVKWLFAGMIILFSSKVSYDITMFFIKKIPFASMK